MSADFGQTEPDGPDEASNPSSPTVLTFSSESDHACEADDVEYLGTDEANRYLQCQRCETVYIIADTISTIRRDE